MHQPLKGMGSSEMKLSFHEQKYHKEKMNVWGRDQVSCNMTSVERKVLPSCVVEFRLSQL